MQFWVLTRKNAHDIFFTWTRVNAKTGGGEKTVDTVEVKKRMKEKNITALMMARELGMDQSTYYRKMQKNGDEFSAIDLMTFKRVLCLDEKTAVDFLLS